MSFKTFMQTQYDDIPPEAFQARYEEYQVSHLNELSETFFRTARGDEWFQCRYNPVKLMESETETTAEASRQAAALKALVLSKPAFAVKEFRLGPEYAPILSRLGTMQATPQEPEDRSSSADSPSELHTSLRHCSGHYDRTLAFSSIHACCTRGAFKTAITDALAAADPPIAAPERIILGQPVWTAANKFERSPARFERSGWIVMPTADDAKAALVALLELRIGVPGPNDEERGEPTTLFTFCPQVVMHTPRANFVMSDIFSIASRVAYDTVRAVELSATMDGFRSVPEESRLAALLAEIPAEAFVLPTDKLDLAIGYLRRVHLLSYYMGKKFVDEAHMLTYAANIQSRSAPYRLEETASSVVGGAEGAAADAGTAEAVVVAAGSGASEGEAPTEAEAETTSKKRKAEDQGEGSGADAATDAPAAPIVAEEARVTPAAPVTKAPPPLNPLDRRIDDIVSSLHGRELTRDQDDARDILAEQGRVFDELIASQCKYEVDPAALRPDPEASHAEQVLAEVEDIYRRLAPDKVDELAGLVAQYVGAEDRLLIETKQRFCKARCCYPACNKLFKNIDFLKKHVKAKHVLFAAEPMLRVSEPHMRARYDALDVALRQLPPVDVEKDGQVLQMNVQEVWASVHEKARSKGRGRPLDGHHRGGARGSGDGYRDDRRMSGGRGRDLQLVVPMPRDDAHPMPAQSNRPVTSYMDVDAPKV